MTAAGASQADPFREPFPWDEVMRIGLGVLRLSPKNFWAMTPREFAAATGSLGQSGAPPGRGELERMMDQFPDRKERHA